MVETRRAFQSRGNRFRLHVGEGNPQTKKRAPCGDIAAQPHHLDEFKPVCQAFGFRRMMGTLPRGSEITVTQAMTIVCYIAVSAETRTSVAELAPTVADATERCCAGRIAGLLAEGGGGRSDALIHGTCPLAAGLHSADSHDGRDDGVDFLGRSLLIRLFIAGRILVDADV